MSFLKNLFNKPTQKLHLSSLEQKMNIAFHILDQFTSLVSSGIEDIKQLKHDKVFIKSSILFIYREMKQQPRNDYILKKHLTLGTKEEYDQYLDSLSQMLNALSKFSIDTENNKLTRMLNSTKNIDEKVFNEMGFQNVLDNSTKELDGFFTQIKENTKEYAYYLSELHSIDNDLNNGTSFKKIRFYDYE